MTGKRDYSEITPQIQALSDLCTRDCVIDRQLYIDNKVNRGLRDLNGKGVLTGLTKISEIQARTPDDQPCDGSLFYQGYNIEDLVKGFLQDGRYGFEEITYLLLFGALPNARELEEFRALLASYRSLPNSFVRDIIMKAPSTDIMNSMARSVLTLYSYDNKPDDTSLPNVLRQCVQLIAVFPQLALYGYQAYDYYRNDSSHFFIHDPVPELSTAENILQMLRPDASYTQTEARVLDMALVVHAEHGGGNNSSFTTHVVTSSGTDTYSAIAAALGSLKGPKHGGANIKVCHMFDEIKREVKDWSDEDEIRAYLNKILQGEAFDHSGLIYGVGHAIYSKSDPRARIFKNFVHMLATEKGMEQEYQLYADVERLAPEVISGKRKMYKGVSANVDFYSGFVYQMLGIPEELFTPIFAVARISGWSAHRLEELINGNRIIRPAYKAIRPRRDYVPMEERE
ncbi:MAG: citrate/2-methylcitrate synthase [Clostridiales bacterium]|nr:citrate/2-methylcitrate synthase [Clostridiales bacterium]